MRYLPADVRAGLTAPQTNYLTVRSFSLCIVRLHRRAAEAFLSYWPTRGQKFENSRWAERAGALG